MNDLSDAHDGRSGPDIAGLVISQGCCCLRAMPLECLELGGGPSYSQVGLAVAVEIVAFGLGVLAIFNGIYSLRGCYIGSDSYDLAPVLIIAGGFAVLIAIIWLDGGFIRG